LFIQVQNLRQKDINVKEYTKEFYRLGIYFGLDEPKDLRVARYVNGLRFMIQDELRTQHFHSIEEAFQVALKVEEKLDRKHQNGRDKGIRGKGRENFGRSQVDARDEDEASSNHSFERGTNTGRGREGGYIIICHQCGR
jgi:hypothetical protein